MTPNEIFAVGTAVVGFVIWVIRLEGKVFTLSKREEDCKDNFKEDLKEIKAMINRLLTIGSENQKSIAELSGWRDGLDKK